MCVWFKSWSAYTKKTNAFLNVHHLLSCRRGCWAALNFDVMGVPKQFFFLRQHAENLLGDDNLSPNNLCIVLITAENCALLNVCRVACRGNCPQLIMRLRLKPVQSSAGRSLRSSTGMATYWTQFHTSPALHHAFSWAEFLLNLLAGCILCTAELQQTSFYQNSSIATLHVDISLSSTTGSLL